MAKHDLLQAHRQVIAQWVQVISELLQPEK